MEHVAIPDGEIHQPQNFTYADAATRNAAVIENPEFVNSIALQSDDGSFWRLVSVSPAVWQFTGRRNEAGQIKANYGSSLSVSNFSTGAPNIFDINAATPSLSSSPTTTYPFSAPTKTYADLFDATRGTGPTGRLIENPIGGQFHIWRIQGFYENKANAQTGGLKIRIRNLVSGFSYDQNIFLADGITTDTFNITLFTIADSASIPSPNGYILDAISTFNDGNLAVEIESITRISNAIGYGVT